jgi:hypothetical protein
MSKILFAKTYPYSPGKVDALVLISKKALALPEEVVILPPFPTIDYFKDDDEFFNTIEVNPDEIPQGIESMEISPESFLALNASNPNAPPVVDKEEVVKTMSAKEILEKPWDKGLLGGTEGSVDDED